MESLLSHLTKLNGEALQDFGQGSDMPWLSFQKVFRMAGQEQNIGAMVEAGKTL